MVISMQVTNYNSRNKELFNQVRRVILAGVNVFDFEEQSVNFEYNFEDSANANICIVKLYNLIPETVRLFKKDTPIQVVCGYESTHGSIFQGVVECVSTYVDGADLCVEIKCTNNSSPWFNRKITEANGTWSSGTPVIQVVSDLISTGDWLFGKIDIPSDKVYSRGITITGKTIRDALIMISKDNNLLPPEFVGNYVHMRKPGTLVKTIVNLSPRSGLIQSPKVTPEGDLEITTVLRPDIDLQSHIVFTEEVKMVGYMTNYNNILKQNNGSFRVKKGSVVADDNDAYCRFILKYTTKEEEAYE